MVFVENQILTPYMAGIIQMVPGRTGYEPAQQGDAFEETDPKRTYRETRYLRPRLPNDKYETTYTENRRLASSGTSDLGSFIDIYA